ncbi:MAG: L,D-transpeptidase family protein, partial [Clostridiales bacterium]|nr:L,D-transpeptidase family protein [Clostridiales bacterium]
SYTCWYYTQFYGNYLFHSVLYYPGSMTRVKDGRLGMNLSHGCVRLSMTNAKWIYDNIPIGTKVYVY